MERKEKLFVVFAAAMTIAVFASNIAAAKLWNLFGIAVDGGLLIFPVTYVVGDLLVEFYGEKRANYVSVLATVLNLVVMGFMMLVVALPTFPGFEGGEAFASVMGFSLRITMASLIAFLLSRWTNNWCFVKIKLRQKQKMELLPDDDFPELAVPHFRLRELGSSLVGRLIDNIIFETIAFIGVLPMGDFLAQMGMAYVEGVVVEGLLILFISQPLVNLCRRYVGDF